jgi:ribosome-associated protein
MSDNPGESTSVVLRGDYITLAQALKLVGVASSGGEAKYFVREGGVSVNGEPATQPGKKLRAGDRFSVTGGGEWTITA